jgi:tripartite ATP-independent transporter DctM subunit
MVVFMMLLMFILMGTPMAAAFTMIVPSGLYYWLSDVPLSVLAQKMASGAQSFPLLAIPFFVLAGELMNTGGITDRLIHFANVLVGRFTGGLGHVVVVSNVIMAGISGSAAADAAGTGSVLIPAMVKRGYAPAFSAAIVAAAATIGPIIPPSIPMVIFGALAEVSTSRLLIGGVIPGLLMGAYLMVTNYLVAKRRGYPREAASTWREVFTATVKALPALGLPFIIVGGIVLGAFTPTEAAVVAVVYALVLGMLIYRELKLRDLWGIAVRTSAMVAAIMFLIGATNILGDVMTREHIDKTISSFFLGFTANPMVILLMVNIMLLVLGIPLEPIPLMLIFIPVLVPLMNEIGVNTVHFGVVMVLNLMIALLTPPVGMVMFIMMSMSKCTMWEFTKEIWPFMVALLAVLLLIVYIPGLVLWLPDTLLGVSKGR